MIKQLRASIIMLAVLSVVTGLLYPFAMTVLAQAIFPYQANGSLIMQNGKAVGSTLIGQNFDDPKYFWGRLSATAPVPYTAFNANTLTGSSGSNYGPLNPALIDAVKARIDALKAAGHGSDSEAMQRVLVFVSRCQNLESPHNTTPFAAKVNDGGFYYTPAAGGSSQAGNDENTGGLRSYGSMTYAGLKSMIYAGVKADDVRVQKAIEWLKKHYTVETNPGMPQGNQGLYYYYQTFAKALAALGQDTFVDDKGVTHDWRKDLIDALAARQKSDGSWVNENQRWLEGDASLATGYALLALSYCKK